MPDPLALTGLGGARAPLFPILSTGAERASADLQARMALLKTVLDNPAGTVARYIRLGDRPLRRIFAPSPAPRLRPGHPPGYDRRRLQDWAMDILM